MRARRDLAASVRRGAHRRGGRRAFAGALAYGVVRRIQVVGGPEGPKAAV